MDLLDSYIQTLRVFLPRDQRDDIIRELTEDINAQMADSALELGRPLTLDEQTAIVGQYGHPMLMAARYRPQRHLVGPVIFPYYWLVLKVVLGLVIAGHVISVVVLLAGGAPWSEVATVGGHLVRTALTIGGWFTLLAAVTDRSLIRSGVLENWNPTRILPRMHRAGTALRRMEQVVAQRGHGRLMPPGQSSSLASLFVGVVLSAWWLLSLKFPVLLLGGGATLVAWGPAMDRVFPFLVFMQIVALAEHAVRVMRPDRTGFLRLTRVVWAVGLPIFIYFLRTADHQWVVWRSAPEAHARFDAIVVVAGRTLSLLDLFNYLISIALIVIACAGVARVLLSLVRWFRGRGPSAVHV
ncbi:MAG TPA: hypothetical protein VI485_29890 [Vicinamibacterales bacterium]|nr:hypothetical protein [Vicinamibacterales bacterium]